MSAETLGARGQAPKSRWPRPATPSEHRTSGNVGRLSLPTMASALLCREPFPAPSDQCGPRRAGSVPLLSSLVLLGQGLPTARPGVACPSCLAQGRGANTSECLLLSASPRGLSYRHPKGRNMGVGGGAPPPRKICWCRPKWFFNPPVHISPPSRHPHSPGDCLLSPSGHPRSGSWTFCLCVPPADCPSHLGQPHGSSSQPASYRQLSLDEVTHLGACSFF